jgi:hypothetical protein
MGEKVFASDLSGRRIDLDDGRYVFVGAHPKYPDDVGVVMRNAAGECTSFRLTKEAADALSELLDDPEAGVPGSPPPAAMHQAIMIWKAVVSTPAPPSQEEG